MRKRIFEIIQIGKEKDWLSKAFDFTVVILIIINIVLSVCFTFDELNEYRSIFTVIEGVTVFLFIIEFVLRLWTADYLYDAGRIKSALRYIVSFNGIVELLSIVPFFMPLLFPKGLVVFRMFRVARILRLFQANTYSDSLSTIMIVVKRKKSQLLSSIMIIVVLMIMSSLVMYGFEHEAQPEVFKNAFSGIWWSTSTLLTVGYGDIYPVTFMGQFASILITFLGVGMVAIPTGILSAGFTEYTREQRVAEEQKEHKSKNYCPYCGEKISEEDIVN
ncbi:MAG: ion transporter [Suipraeoptans sp.]